MTDDLLIETATNVRNLCKKFDKLDAKLDDHLKTSDIKINNKVDLPTFRWVIGILIMVMIISGGAVVANKSSLSENCEKIKQLQEKAK